MWVNPANRLQANEVSNPPETDERADLARMNEQLKASLARCRFMLADARAKLAANSNEQEPEAPEAEDGEEQSG